MQQISQPLQLLDVSLLFAAETCFIVDLTVHKGPITSMEHTAIFGYCQADGPTSLDSTLLHLLLFLGLAFWIIGDTSSFKGSLLISTPGNRVSGHVLSLHWMVSDNQTPLHHPASLKSHSWIWGEGSSAHTQEIYCLDWELKHTLQLFSNKLEKNNTIIDKWFVCQEEEMDQPCRCIEERMTMKFEEVGVDFVEVTEYLQAQHEGAVSKIMELKEPLAIL